MPKPPALPTALIHHPYAPPPGFVAPQPGVFKASTVIYPTCAALQARDWRQRSGYTYGLHGTPTTFMLEERIATLEGGRHTLLVPSGLAAITLVDMCLLATGDEVLIPDNAYGPGKELARRELSRWGIAHRFYDAMDPAAFAAAIGPATKLVWLEAPGSITMEFPDLAALVQAARASGVTTAIDNTWGSGIAFDPFALGIDISAHALTKFPSGGGDVLMGAVTTRDHELHLKLKTTHMHMGYGVGANDAETLLRALPTVALRYAAQDASARELARWWQSRPEISAVMHPALPGAPGHEHWRSLCTQAAGLFSVRFDERHPAARVHAFVDALRLFRIGHSWAGPVSLVVPYDLEAIRPGSGQKGTVVRFSIGFEAVEDLIADLQQALEAAFGPR